MQVKIIPPKLMKFYRCLYGGAYELAPHHTKICKIMPLYLLLVFNESLSNWQLYWLKGFFFFSHVDGFLLTGASQALKKPWKGVSGGTK